LHKLKKSIRKKGIKKSKTKPAVSKGNIVRTKLSRTGGTMHTSLERIANKAQK
jgi:hypothetical protein